MIVATCDAGVCAKFGECEQKIPAWYSPNLLRETLVRLDDVPRVLPKRLNRQGKRVRISLWAVRRWATEGMFCKRGPGEPGITEKRNGNGQKRRRVRLEVEQWGQDYYTSLEALVRFSMRKQGYDERVVLAKSFEPYWPKRPARVDQAAVQKDRKEARAYLKSVGVLPAEEADPAAIARERAELEALVTEEETATANHKGHKGHRGLRVRRGAG